MQLTRIELSNFTQRINAELAQFTDGSPERANAIMRLRNIRTR